MDESFPTNKSFSAPRSPPPPTSLHILPNIKGLDTRYPFVHLARYPVLSRVVARYSVFGRIQSASAFWSLEHKCWISGQSNLQTIPTMDVLEKKASSSKPIMNLKVIFHEINEEV